VGCVNTIKCDRKWQPAVVRQNNDPTQFYCYYQSTRRGKEINDIFYEGKFVHFLANEGNRIIDMAPLILNPLNAELNPFCHLLALLGAHPILHVSRIRVKLGTS
jgi:hypothetical protein